MVIGAVGLVLRRAWSRRGLVLGVSATALLGCVMVTATVLLLLAAGRGSVAGALAGSSASQRLVVVTGDLDDPAALPAADAGVREVLEEALGQALDPTVGGEDVTPGGPNGTGEVVRRVVSSSYAAPRGALGAPEGGAEALTVVATYDDLPEHAELTAGSWPADGAATGAAGGVTDVALHRSAAAETGLRPGDRLRLVNALDDSRLTVRVTGLFRPVDPASGYWAGDALGVSGVDRGDSFVTYGPLVAGAGAEERIAGATTSWRADPDLAGLAPDAVAGLERGTVGLVEDGPDELAGVLPGADVETDLDEVLDDVAVPVAVARSAVGLPLALVALLAVSAVLLLTRLVQEDRSQAAALQSSRGFSAAQLRLGNAVEGLLVVVPAALVAPPLAWLTARSAASWSGADAVLAQLRLEPEAWLAAAAYAVVVLVLLTRRGAARGVRGGVVATWSRRGLDLVVLPLALLAVVQLLSYGDGALAERAGASLGGPGADPVLALTVPVVLLAAALLLGRLVRGLLVAGAGLAARGRGAVGSMASWQLARRADEHRAMLVATVLAGAVAAFATAHLQTFTDSEEAQAAFAVGADVRIVGPDARSVEAVVGAVDEAGGDSVVVVRERTALGDLPIDLLALDPRAAAPVLSSGEPGEDWAGLLAPVGTGGARPAALPALVSDAVAERAGRQGVGGQVRVRVAGVDLALAVAGRTAHVPATGPNADQVAGLPAGNAATGDAVVVDRAAVEPLVGAALARDAETEVWAAVPRSGLSALRAGLEERAGAVTVVDRWTVAERGADGAVGAGLRAALVLAVLASGLFGLIGFLASAGAGLRRRRTEVAALRATGLSRAQVRASLLAERLGLLGVALVLGCVCGVLAAWGLLPRLVLTEDAAFPVPGVSVGLAWGLLAAVVLGLAAVASLLLRVLVGRVSSRPVAAELRSGEDT